MGSATRDALSEARALLSERDSDGLTTGEQLFQAARVIDSSSQLRTTLADPAADAEGKKKLVDTVFAGFSAHSRELLTAMSAARWSSADDLLGGIEEIGIRSVAGAADAKVSVQDELFAFGALVSSDPELELSVSSKLGSAESKAQLVRTLVEKKVSAPTLAILVHLVQLPRGRRIGELIRQSAAIVADQSGQILATVTTATAVTAAQLTRLATALSTTYGRSVHINQVLDPSVVGGVRVQVGDDVIDGTVVSRLHDLRLQLAV